MQSGDLTLTSVSEPDLLNASSMRQMPGTFLRYEKTLLVAKLRGARQRMRAKEGLREGRRLYAVVRAKKPSSTV